MLFHEGEHRREMAWAVREVDETVRRINERRAERGAGRACAQSVAKKAHRQRLQIKKAAK